MKLSTKGTYGLRAMIDIAINSKESPVSIKDISDREDISLKYLEKLMTTLKKSNLISSVRGPKGGYILRRSPKDISIGEILRALEGNLNPVDCKLLMEENCNIEDDCIMKFVWNRISDAINNAVDSMSLQDLLEKSINSCCVGGCNI